MIFFIVKVALSKPLLLFHACKTFLSKSQVPSLSTLHWTVRGEFVPNLKSATTDVLFSTTAFGSLPSPIAILTLHAAFHLFLLTNADVSFISTRYMNSLAVDELTWLKMRFVP